MTAVTRLMGGPKDGAELTWPNWHRLRPTIYTPAPLDLRAIYDPYDPDQPLIGSIGKYDLIGEIKAAPLIVRIGLYQWAGYR